ncbi:MAG TPA: carboxypeptidase-like regulatory domain-containing protein [Bryobacteraceae bacterium]|nr:carboxypeptidase-like regulatory domain-containing protein [Bryobacteraceae bacterium]
MLRYRLHVLLLAAFGGFALVCGSAQTLTGRISGTITDPSAASVAGAKITIINTDTQATRTAASDDHGFYVVEDLPIGPYRVEVAQSGFKRISQTGMQVEADSRLTADFKLQIGEATQTVDVVEAGPTTEVLNTVSGEVAHVVDQNQVENLGLNGRAYVEFLTLVPGAVVTNPDQFSVLTSLSATNQSLNGHRTNQNNFTVDGVGNLDNGSNGSLINNVKPDFLQEVKINGSNFSSQYGRSTGAAFNIVTRNGSNQIHGALFEYFRNDALDARNFFSANNNELRYNDWGGDLGGPIKKNKIFFFVGEDWTKIRQTTAGTRVTLPSTAELQGIFPANHVIDQPGTKTPFPNNTIPASMITVDGQATANVYNFIIPQCTIWLNNGASNDCTLQNPNPLDYRQDLGRLDYKINDRHSIYMRWIDDYNSIYTATGAGGSLPVSPEIRDRPGKSGLISETWVISPTIVNEAHLGASWNSQHYWNQGTSWERTTEGYQFQRVFNSVGPYVNGIPDMSITSFTGWTGPAHTLISPTTEIEANDAISIVRGQHSIRMGVMIIRNRKDQNGRSLYDGSITFNNAGNPNTTGYAMADALVGNFLTYTEAAYDPMGHYRYTEPAAFVDDSWKVSRRLSVNLGMRYEYMMAMYSTPNNLAEFVPSLYNPAQAVKYDSSGNIVAGSGNIFNGLVRVANGITPAGAYLVPNANDPAVLAVPDGAPRGMYPSQGTWSPRVGLAYALNDKTVIRGGYGLFYDRMQGNPTFYTLNNPPYVGSSQYSNANLANIKAGGTVITPWGTIQTIDPNLKIPYSQQFSLGIQRTLPMGIFADVTYVGTLSRHLLDEPDINQPSFAVISQYPSTTSTNLIRPYQGYSTIQQFQSRATSNYNALQVYVTKRRGKVLMTAAYTFSKNLGDADSDTSNNRNYFDVRAYYGPVNFNVYHSFAGTFQWDLPRLRNWNKFLRTPIGGWQLSSIIHLQTGFTTSVTSSPAIVGSRLADYVGGPSLLDNPGPNGWTNPAAFAVSPYTRWGTAGPGIIVGPGMQIYNLSLTKFFYYKERYSLRFRADFLNAFNCVNFQNPSGDKSSSSFGTISSAYPSRNINFGMKLTF